MAFLRIRFNAKETHCPASAVSTGALYIVCEDRVYSAQQCNKPLPLDRLDCSICPATDGVWSNHDRVSCSYSPRVENPIYYRANIRYRPHYNIEIRILIAA